MDFPKEPNLDISNFSPLKQPFYPVQKKLPKDMLASYSPDLEYEHLMSAIYPKSLDQPKIPQPSHDPFPQYNKGTFYDSYNNNPFTTKFPRASNYSNFASILEALPHLEGLNNPHFDVESVDPEAHFYIMRSSNDDNIHKAIKYHIWSTTTSGKQVISQAWKSFEQKHMIPQIYLIFSVVNSNHFLGVAKVVSNINHDETFKYWWEPCKWFGTFQLKWLFVKDIHHSHFRHLKEEVIQESGNMPLNQKFISPVINLRDSTKIGADVGKQILDIFVHHPMAPNIFESFAYMDRREDLLRAQRDKDPEFLTYFAECCMSYKQSPETFRLYSNKPHYKKEYNKNSKQNQAFNSEQHSSPYKESQEGRKDTTNTTRGRRFGKYNSRGRGHAQGGRGGRFNVDEKQANYIKEPMTYDEYKQKRQAEVKKPDGQKFGQIIDEKKE